jgi:hypothetical protein
MVEINNSHRPIRLDVAASHPPHERPGHRNQQDQRREQRQEFGHLKGRPVNPGRRNHLVGDGDEHLKDDERRYQNPDEQANEIAALRASIGPEPLFQYSSPPV